METSVKCDTCICGFIFHIDKTFRAFFSSLLKFLASLVCLQATKKKKKKKKDSYFFWLDGLLFHAYE